MEKTIVLKPTYLPLSDTKVNGRRLHEFQKEIMNVTDQKEDCLIVEAPTGAGKTFSFFLSSKIENRYSISNKKTIVISPTNSLAHEIYEDAKKEGLKSYVWTSDTLGEWKEKEKNAFSSVENGDIIVSNPDMLSLIISGAYKGDNTLRKKQWTKIFRSISIMVIDEFHSYSEQEMARILAFIILAKATGNTHIRYVFTSATPNSKLTELFDKLKISYRRIPPISPTYDRTIKGERILRGEVKITFTDSDIIDSVDSENPPRGKTLFLADRVITAQIIIRKLHSLGIRDILEITGFNNRSLAGRGIPDQQRYIVATSAAELGLNMGVDVAHIEPGLYFENFRQRFGRVARGKDGEVIVHTNTELVKNISDKIDTEGQLLKELENVLPGRDFYKTKTLRVLSAYLYLVYKALPKDSPLKEDVKSGVGYNELFVDFETFDSKLSKFTAEAKRLRAINDKDLNSINSWWNNYLKAYGFFRGQSINVKVELPDEDECKETTVDVTWMKRNCVYEKRNNNVVPFKITSYRQSRVPIILQYNSPIFGNTVKVDENTLKSDDKLLDTWKKEFYEFFEKNELRPKEDATLIEMRDEIKRLIPNVLRPIYFELLPPKDIGEVNNDIFV